MNTTFREKLKNKKRIVIKIGSSSLTHNETGDMDYIRMEKLVRELSDIRNQGKEVILVSSGVPTFSTIVLGLGSDNKCKRVRGQDGSGSCP